MGGIAWKASGATIRGSAEDARVGLAADKAAGQNAEEKEKLAALPPYPVLTWLRKHGIQVTPKLTKRQKVRTLTQTTQKRWCGWMLGWC